MKNITVAVSGASGSAYALRLIKKMIEHNISINLIVSETAREVCRHETGQTPEDFIAALPPHPDCDIRLFCNGDLFAPVASGSHPTDAMIVIPCSMKTLAAIAGGYAASLIERAADVSLKEKRPLILVTRETPLSLIHLNNMTTAAAAGATIMPAAPGYYHHPATIEDLLDFMADRIFTHLGIAHDNKSEWKGP